MSPDELAQSLGAEVDIDPDELASTMGGEVDFYDSGQSQFAAALSSGIRGAVSVPKGIVGGTGAVAALVPGLEDNALQRAARTMGEATEENVMINPRYQDTALTKAGGALGQAAGQLGTALVSAPLRLGTAGMQAVGLGTAGLMGAEQGAETAKAYGIDDWRGRAALTLGSGLAEAGTEAFGGFGGKSLSSALAGEIADYTKRGVKQAGKDVLTEGLEEVVAGQSQDLLIKSVVEEDEANPGFSINGQKLPPAFFSVENLKNRLEEGALGAVGGTVFGGTRLLLENKGAREGMQLRSAAKDRINELESVEERTPDQEQELSELLDQDAVLENDIASQGVDPEAQNDLLNQSSAFQKPFQEEVETIQGQLQSELDDQDLEIISATEPFIAQAESNPDTQATAQAAAAAQTELLDASTQDVLEDAQEQTQTLIDNAAQQIQQQPGLPTQREGGDQGGQTPEAGRGGGVLGQTGGTEEGQVTDVQGTIIDQGTGGITPIDASQAAVQEPLAQGIVPQGGPSVAGQAPVVEGRTPVAPSVPARPAPVAGAAQRAVGSLGQWAESRIPTVTNAVTRQKLEEFRDQLIPLIQQYEGVFSDIKLIEGIGGGGVRVGELTGTLQIDPKTLFNNLSIANNAEQAKGIFSKMLDEEFRHSVTLELDRTSPKFAQDLQNLWETLPEDVQNLSAETYFKETGSRYQSEWQAKHEFFRQYWQNAEIRDITENALREKGVIDRLYDLIDSFIEALRKLQQGAVPEVKPILDRLIAQAQQRADEIKKQASETQKSAKEPAKAAPKAEKKSEPEESEGKRVASLKRAEVDARRERMGAPAIPTIDTLGWSESDKEAAGILQEDLNAARDLIAARKAEPRPLTQTETSILLFDQARLQNEILKLSEDLEKVPAGVENDLKRGELLAVINSRETELLENDYVYRRTGSESGRSLNARKMEKALDRSQYTLAKMLLKYRSDVTEGKDLTQEERSVVTENSKKIKKAFDELDAIEVEQQKVEAEPVFKKIIQISRQEKTNADETLKQKRKKTFKDLGKSARERLKERKGLDAPRVGLNAPSSRNENFEDYAIVGAEYIEDGATSLEAFTDKMTGEFGSSVKDQIKPLYNRAKEIHAQALATLQKEQAKAKEAAQPSSVLEAGRKRLEGKPRDKVDASLAVKLFKAHVRSNPLATPEQINSLVTKDIQTIYPTATESDVRVAITGYGKAKWPNKDVFAKQEREHKAILRQLETQDRLLKGQAPLKTGLQRDKPTARYRELEAQNKELMKKMGFETTAAGQLASTKKAISNRFKNQIEDLNRIIEGKAKPKTPREQVQYDAELNALKKERDELQAYVDDLTGPSQEGKWNQKKQKAYDRTIENYKRRIAQQDFAARSKPGYQESEATKNLREEMEDARAEFETLKDLSGETVKEQLTREENRLDREIAKVTEEIATGKTPPAGKPKPTNAEIEVKKQHLKILKETRRHLKDANRDDSTRAKATEKSLERSIAELDRRIKQGDTTPAERRTPVENERIKQLRQDRDFLKEVYAGIKAAAEGRRIPEEIALDNFKRYIQKKIREDQQKLGKKEYLEVPTDTRIDTLRERAINAKAATAKAKKDWIESQFNAKLKNKKGYEKFKDRFGEVLGLMRAFMTGAEFSAILRQGKFALGHPFAFGESLKGTWQGFRSEEGLLRIQQEIESRDNFKNGAYDDLAIVDPTATSLEKMEEDFQSRWASKVPFIAGTARAYAGFLNLLRANMFDVIANNHTGGRRPLTREEAKAIADLVNNLTGRGSLGKFENAGPFLNRILFSPKFLASRLNLLTGRGVIWDARPETRKTIAKEYARALAAQMALYALYAMFFKSDDDEIEFDRRSGDFLKIPIGPNTKIDPGAGLLQLIVLATRLWTGETKNKDGEIVALRGEDSSDFQRNMKDIQYDFVRSKLAPIPGFLLNLSLQSGYGGSEYSILPQEASIQSYLDSEVGKMTVPMTWAEIREAGQDLGLSKGAIMALFMMAGEGVQSFPDKENRSR